MSDTTDDSRLLWKLADVARALDVGERTLHRLISSNQFPRADIKLGGKILRWKPETVREWIEANTRQRN